MGGGKFSTPYGIYRYKVWERYFKRKLKKNEKLILFYASEECKTNNKLNNLRENCYANGLKVTHLTKRSGNCMFECFIKNGIGSDIINLRRFLATIFFEYSDYVNFFPHSKQTLFELFNMTNDVKYVFDKDLSSFNKYDYIAMCRDLARGSSWTLLPVELILQLVSYIFKVEFKIITDAFPNIVVINAYNSLPKAERPKIKEVYLGHLFESHYVCVNKIDSKNKECSDFYNDCMIKYVQWIHLNKRKKREITKQRKYNENLNKTKNESSESESNGCEPNEFKFSFDEYKFGEEIPNSILY